MRIVQQMRMRIVVDNHDSVRKQKQDDDELSDDGRTVEWRGGSIPPDIVASANHLKVIKVEPKLIHKNLNSEAVKCKKLVEQDITDFRKYQVELYSNYDYFLDE